MAAKSDQYIAPVWISERLRHCVSQILSRELASKIIFIMPIARLYFEEQFHFHSVVNPEPFDFLEFSFCASVRVRPIITVILRWQGISCNNFRVPHPVSGYSWNQLVYSFLYFRPLHGRVETCKLWGFEVLLRNFILSPTCISSCALSSIS